MVGEVGSGSRAARMGHVDHRRGFVANVSLLFTEVPLLQRPALAAEHGFIGVEMWWPFPTPVPSDRELGELAEAIDRAGLPLVALNFDGGDLAAGDRGLVSIPGQEQRFRDNVECVAAFAAKTGTSRFNALYGNRVGDADEQRAIALDNLAFAAQAVAPKTVLLEPQNRVDSPQYDLTTPADVLGVLDDLADRGISNTAVLCDFYHFAMSGLDLDEVVDACAGRIGHVQIADAPGRHEPGTGTIPFRHLLDRITAQGYRGAMSAEYRPSGRTEDSFSWLPELL